MRSGSVCAAMLLTAAALHAQPPAAELDDTWLDRLNELKCQRTFEFDAPSSDPPLFAMIASCRRVKSRDPSYGPFALVAFDAARNLRATRISAFWSGGLHYTRSGDIVWFSEVNQALVGQRQRFLEAFSLAPQALVERSLGRIELPFVAGDTRLVKGGDCHVLRMQSRLEDSGTPLEHRLLMFDDGRPTDSGHILHGIDEVLFFEPRSKVFIVELEADAGAADETSRRAALDCAGLVAPVDPALARRLDALRGPGGRYLAATTGDLLADVYPDPATRLLSADDYAVAGPRTILFRGEAATVFPPLIRCELVVDEDWCHADPTFSYGWSPSGRHFALRKPGGVLQVYRSEDLRVVYEVSRDLNDGFLFIDDRSAYFVTKRGRLESEAWD